MIIKSIIPAVGIFVVTSFLLNSCNLPNPAKKKAEIEAQRELKESQNISQQTKVLHEQISESPLKNLTANEEALTVRPTAVYPESSLQYFGTDAWKETEPAFALKSEAEVYVLSLDSDFVEVVTLIGKKGWIQISHVKAKDQSSWNKEKYLTKKRIGVVNTKVDGFDVRTVKLWESKTGRDKVVDNLVNGEEVAILQLSDDFVQLGSINGRIGWCMKEFVEGL